MDDVCLIKYVELFTRDCTFMSNIHDEVSIKNFINGLNFEWKLNWGDYRKCSFTFEILYMPNNILGLPNLQNWNNFCLNIDPYDFDDITNVKYNIISHIEKYINVDNVTVNRILIFTINCKHNHAEFKI